MLKRFILLGLVLALSACGTSSHRPRYSGHQESTEGVPGFVNGKKVSPNVKLGQSYEVDGETYVPRYEPDYVEEGMASWYGPGFHGGKTANGERFDKEELTAAHRTLPLPSIVKVTLISSGKSAYVRVNDRGPFAKSRIIDLSYGAAKEIGLIGPGTGRVRVEYMPGESQRFVDLMAQGRDPKDIDVASEVIGQVPTSYAQNTAISTPITVAPKYVNQETYNDAARDTIETRDLSVPSAPQTVQAADAAIATPATPAAVAAPAPAPVAKPQLAYTGSGEYLQLGAFAQEANAQRLQKKVSSVGATHISPIVTDSGTTMYRVRMGPYSNVDESSRVLAQLNGLGITPKFVTK